MYPKTAGAGQLPAWIAFDRQVLSFDAFFREAVHERREEQYRIRKCKVLYYLEDDTIQVNEVVQADSGIPQGEPVKRRVFALFKRWLCISSQFAMNIAGFLTHAIF